jgi:hypothetical protein
MDVKKTECEGLDWIYMSQNRDSWQAFVIMAIKLRIQ